MHASPVVSDRTPDQLLEEAVTLLDVEISDILDQISGLHDRANGLMRHRDAIAAVRDGFTPGIGEPSPPEPAVMPAAPAAGTAKRAKKAAPVAAERPRQVERPVTPAPPKAPPAALERAKERKPTLSSIAEVANAAIARGEPVGPALRAHFGKPQTTVNNWLSKLRRLDMLTKPAKTASALRVVEDNTLPATPPEAPPLAEVAATYKEAVEAGRRPIQTIVDRYDCTRADAQAWVNATRAAGLLPPRPEPQVPAELPPHRLAASWPGE